MSQNLRLPANSEAPESAKYVGTPRPPLAREVPTEPAVSMALARMNIRLDHLPPIACRYSRVSAPGEPAIIEPTVQIINCRARAVPKIFVAAAVDEPAIREPAIVAEPVAPGRIIHVQPAPGPHAPIELGYTEAQMVEAATRNVYEAGRIAELQRQREADAQRVETNWTPYIIGTIAGSSLVAILVYVIVFHFRVTSLPQ